MYCAVLFVHLVMREAGKEPAGELLQSAEREMLNAYMNGCMALNFQD